MRGRIDPIKKRSSAGLNWLGIVMKTFFYHLGRFEELSRKVLCFYSFVAEMGSQAKEVTLRGLRRTLKKGGKKDRTPW